MKLFDILIILSIISGVYFLATGAILLKKDFKKFYDPSYMSFVFLHRKKYVFHIIASWFIGLALLIAATVVGVKTGQATFHGIKGPIGKNQNQPRITRDAETFSIRP